MRYLAYYFSATGNTERGLSLIGRELERAGHTLSALPLQASTRPNPAAIAGAELLLIAFPTLAFIPPVMVQRFIRRLPAGGGKRAAVFTADGGGCLTAPSVASRLLRRRGYEVVVSGAASYPENWTQAVPLPPREQQAEQLERGDAMARAFARRLLAGERSLHTVRPLFRLIGRLAGGAFALYGRRFLGMLYFADDTCSGCGLCARACPVAAIRMERLPPSTTTSAIARAGASTRRGGDTRPRWSSACEDCNRCINLCPSRSINLSWLRGGLMLAVGTLLLVALIGLADRHLRPLLEAGLAPALAGGAWALVILGLLLLGHWFLLGPTDLLLLRPLQRLRFLRGAFAAGPNRAGGRYLAPGFRPR